MNELITLIILLLIVFPTYLGLKKILKTLTSKSGSTCACSQNSRTDSCNCKKND